MNYNSESDKKSSHDTEFTEYLYPQYYPKLLKGKYYQDLANGVREDIGIRILTPEEMTRITNLERLSIDDIELIRYHVAVLTHGWSLQRTVVNWSLIQFSLFGSSRAAGAIVNRTPRWQQAKSPENESEDEEFARVFSEEDSSGFSFVDVATDLEKKEQYEEEQAKKRPRSRWDFVPNCWQEFLSNSTKGLVDGFVAVAGRNKSNGGGFIGYMKEYFSEFADSGIVSTNRQTITNVKEYDLPCLGVYRGLGSVREYPTQNGQVRTSKPKPMIGINLQVALVVYETLEQIAMHKYLEKNPGRKGGFFEALPEHKNSFAVRAFNYTFKYLDLTFGSPWKINAKDGYSDIPRPEHEPSPEQTEEEPTTEQQETELVPEPEQSDPEPPEEKEIEPIQAAAIALEALANSGLEPELIAQTERRVKKKVEKQQAVFIQERTEKEKKKKQHTDIECNKLYAAALYWKRKVLESHGSLGSQAIQIFSDWEECRQGNAYNSGDIEAITRIELRQLKQEAELSGCSGSVPFWQSCFGSLSGILHRIGGLLGGLPLTSRTQDGSRFTSIHAESLNELYQSLQGFNRIASEL